MITFDRNMFLYKTIDENGQIGYSNTWQEGAIETPQEEIELLIKKSNDIYEIEELKAELEKWKEDIEQVELFGMERSDYEEKKQRCAEIILRLRVLQKGN